MSDCFEMYLKPYVLCEEDEMKTKLTSALEQDHIDNQNSLKGNLIKSAEFFLGYV